MRRRPPILILLVLLSMSVFLSVPAEDVPETSYDESEEMAYEETPLFDSVLPQVAVQTDQMVPRSLDPRPGGLPLLAPACVRGSDSKPLAGVRMSLALLCTLLC